MAGRTGAQNGARPAAMPMRLSGIAKLYRQSGLFTWQLRGGSRDSLRPGLQDPWKGNATRGSDIMAYRSSPASLSLIHISEPTRLR